MSNVGLVGVFYYGGDAFATTDQRVAPIYKIRLNMKDMLVTSYTLPTMKNRKFEGSPLTSLVSNRCDKN